MRRPRRGRGRHERDVVSSEAERSFDGRDLLVPGVACQSLSFDLERGRRTRNQALATGHGCREGQRSGHANVRKTKCGQRFPRSSDRRIVSVEAVRGNKRYGHARQNEVILRSTRHPPRVGSRHGRRALELLEQSGGHDVVARLELSLDRGRDGPGRLGRCVARHHERGQHVLPVERLELQRF